MKTPSSPRWSSSVRLTRPRFHRTLRQCHCQRSQSTVAALQEATPSSDDTTRAHRTDHRTFPSPPPYLAKASSRLNALHARLSLPDPFPVETLARCLIHSTADTNPRFNNTSFSLLGDSLLVYYTSEAVMCRYPRLPTQILRAAMDAYQGPRTLTALCREWGVETAASPGGEVDPGMLQFGRVEAGNAGISGTGIQVKELMGKRTPNPILQPDIHGQDVSKPKAAALERSARHVESTGSKPESYEEEDSKDLQTPSSNLPRSPAPPPAKGTTLQVASTSFVQALFGAYYLHGGLAATKSFFNAHILSRHLDVSSLFVFDQPTRDLARLCARESFLSPTARILAETGRASRHPVFVVGVFSGREKLGEGQGASLDEARVKAAINALKGWYLYSPLDVRMPSQAVKGEKWEPCFVDGGEIVV